MRQEGTERRGMRMCVREGVGEWVNFQNSGTREDAYNTRCRKTGAV